MVSDRYEIVKQLETMPETDGPNVLHVLGERGEDRPNLGKDDFVTADEEIKSSLMGLLRKPRHRSVKKFSAGLFYRFGHAEGRLRDRG